MLEKIIIDVESGNYNFDNSIRVIKKRHQSAVSYFWYFKTDAFVYAWCHVACPINYYKCCIDWHMFLRVEFNIL